MDYMFETQEKSLDPQGRRILTDGDLNGLSGDLIMASKFNYFFALKMVFAADSA